MPNALAEMRLPEDILLTISEQLDSKADIASLCQVVRSLSFCSPEDLTLRPLFLSFSR